MKNNLIHLVVMEWEYEAERGVDIEPFSDLKEAESYFEQLIKTEKFNSWIKDLDSLVEEIEDRSYYAYDEDGEAQTHTHITLQSNLNSPPIYPIQQSSSGRFKAVKISL